MYIDAYVVTACLRVATVCPAMQARPYAWAMQARLRTVYYFFYIRVLARGNFDPSAACNLSEGKVRLR